MPKVKALVSFAGIVTMGKGETKDIDNENIVNDLVSAGYVETMEEKKATKGRVKNENK